MSDQPIIDVVIPVHDSSRPLQRAVDSLMESGLTIPTELRINVVSHNIAASEIEAILSDEVRDKVRILELADGEPSPAGPFMFGITSATGEYVSIMGSDDSLEPGALRAWLDVAQAGDLSAVIPPERHAAGNKVATPPIRPFHTGNLHPLKDRLAYRTAPLGLIRRSAVARLGLDMPPRLRNGSDQLFGLKLWFSGERIGYARRAPKYVVGADAKSRVTFTVRPAVEDLRAISELFADGWTRAQSLRVRRAIVAKSVRVHVFSAALLRSNDDRWTEDDRRYIAEMLIGAESLAPGYLRVLSLADRGLVDALLQGTVASSALRALLKARSRFGHPATILTRDIRGLLASDGPIRFMVAAKLL